MPEPFAKEDLDRGLIGIIIVKGNPIGGSYTREKKEKLTSDVRYLNFIVDTCIKNAVEDFKRDAIYEVTQYANDLKEALAVLKDIPTEPEGKNERV